MNEQYETLLVERDGGRVTITLNRPHVRNAMNDVMVDELITVLNGIKVDESVRIVVMRGADGQFCAGGDLKGLRGAVDRPTEEVAADHRKLAGMLDLHNRLPQTVVAQVEGVAIGAGMALVCVSDVAIGTADTLMGLGTTALGFPPSQVAPFVVQRIGVSQTRRITMTAAQFTGEEAERLGVLHFVVPDRAQLDEKTAEIMHQIERCAPRANAGIKEMLHQLQVMPLEEGLDMAAEQFAAAVQGNEGREGIAAFFEKRKPRWHPEYTT